MSVAGGTGGGAPCRGAWGPVLSGAEGASPQMRINGPRAAPTCRGVRRGRMREDAFSTLLDHAAPTGSGQYPTNALAAAGAIICDFPAEIGATTERMLKEAGLL